MNRFVVTVSTVCLAAALSVGCHHTTAKVNTPPTPQPIADQRPVQQAASTPAPVQRETPAATPQETHMTRQEAKEALTAILSRMNDVYFDYNKSDLRPDGQKILSEDVATLRQILKDYPETIIQIEGNCDQRGSDEYNIALGDRRAVAARDYLVTVGIPADHLKVISYGKEKPVCTDENEDCWSKNRHDHFTAAGL